MKQTIKSIFEDNGIIAIFSDFFPTLYAAIFTEPPENYDNYIIFRWGNFPCVDGLTTENAVKIVASYIAVKSQRWQQLATALNVVSDGTNGGEIRTKKGTINRVSDNTDTRINSEKTFNDTEFADDSKAQTVSNVDGMETYNITETVDKKQTIADTSENVKLRRQYDLQNEIISDIVKELTLCIYSL